MAKDYPLGVIVFAHGANLSPDGYRALQRTWMLGGYAVFSPTFVDSESHPEREAADRPLILRNRLAVFGELAQQVQAELEGEREVAVLPGLGANADLPIFAAGHSYGAYIAQILAGASVVEPGNGETHTLPSPANLRGVIALSPPLAFPGFSPRGSWRDIAVPMLVQSGPGDVSYPFVTDWRQHYDSHCDVIASGSGVASFTASYTQTDHYFGGTIGRVADEPRAKARGDVSAFGILSLIFMDEAARGGEDWSRLTKMLDPLAETGAVDAEFTCSPVE